MSPHVELHPDEKVLAMVRKHWLMFAMEHIGFMFAVLVPVIILPFAGALAPGLADIVGGDKLHYVVVFIIASWLLLMWMMFAVMITNYYLDILIVTDKRLIDIDQVGLFSRDVAVVPVEKIEDIKTEVFGIIPTFFHFGDLQVQTAGGETQIRIRGIRNPQDVKNQIMDAYHKER